MYEYILLDQKDAVATITLNRPEAGNAFASAEYDEVRRAVEDCGREASVRVVVVTGAGKFFSAGGDVKKFKERLDAGEALPREGVLAAGAMTDAVRQCPKPVVAKVNGAAVGAGCALALACDFRVMTPKSRLGMGFINMGFSGDSGGIYFLERLVGLARMTELVFLGDLVGGEEAFRLGLASRLAPEGELDRVTEKLAAELAAKPTQAIGRQKRLFYEFFFRDLPQFNLREADLMCESQRSADHREAVAAFLEKRPPRFSGQ